MRYDQFCAYLGRYLTANNEHALRGPERSMLKNTDNEVVAERVGFVPDEPAVLNDLGRMEAAKNRQIL